MTCCVPDGLLEAPMVQEQKGRTMVQDATGARLRDATGARGPEGSALCAADSLSEFQPCQAFVTRVPPRSSEAGHTSARRPSEAPAEASAKAGKSGLGLHGLRELSTTDTESKGGGAFQFQAVLTKEGAQGFGLAHVPAQPLVPGAAAALVVVDFQPGGVAALWNERQQTQGRPEKALRQGDRIIGVSGVRGDLDRMRQLVRDDAVELTVERWPNPVVTRLCKGSERDVYGMQMDVVDRSNGVQALVVSQFADGGLVAQWNQQAVSAGRFFQVVETGSEVVRVGTHTLLPRMLEALRSDLSSVQVEFRRPVLQ